MTSKQLYQTPSMRRENAFFCCSIFDGRKKSVIMVIKAVTALFSLFCIPVLIHVGLTQKQDCFFTVISIALSTQKIVGSYCSTSKSLHIFWIFVTFNLFLRSKEVNAFLTFHRSKGQRRFQNPVKHLRWSFFKK